MLLLVESALWQSAASVPRLHRFGSSQEPSCANAQVLAPYFSHDRPIEDTNTKNNEKKHTLEQLGEGSFSYKYRPTAYGIPFARGFRVGLIGLLSLMPLLVESALRAVATTVDFLV